MNSVRGSLLDQGTRFNNLPIIYNCISKRGIRRAPVTAAAAVFPRPKPVSISQNCNCEQSSHETVMDPQNAPNLLRPKTFTYYNINPRIKEMEYAVKGPLLVRAGELESELKKGMKKPFTNIILANIGDCHAMGQITITYPRQVMAVCLNPQLLNDPKIPSDVKIHAQKILNACQGGSMGSYTESAGLEVVRNDVAKYISERDGGVPSDPNTIILTSGAGEGIKYMLELVSHIQNGKPAGVMIPIPQYPLYSASVTQYGLHQIDYYLDEEHAWALDPVELRRAVTSARMFCNPKVVCVINPGNPTGQVLTKENIQNVVKFAYQENLCILADEVYQENIYAKDCEFHSFKKVMREMPAPYNTVELVSFHTVSKGYMGECGIRGGYLEAVNMDPEVFLQLRKSFLFCNTTAGQACMDCVVCRPKLGDPSYELFAAEVSSVLNSLTERANIAADVLRSIPGVHCNEVQGAMYAFPRIELPEYFIQNATEHNRAPDFHFAMQLLENTGVCILPGSGFGQIPGTYHFRTTILPPTRLLKSLLDKIKVFHNSVWAANP